MFFNHLIVASAGLAALATSSATPKLIDVPAYDLGTPLGKSAVADACEYISLSQHSDAFTTVPS